MELRNNIEKMAALVRLLRRDINGEVTDSMERCGIHYESNWGVSLPAIRRAAMPFSPDHGFARFLYGQPLREMLLSAYIIADPGAVDIQELEFWGAGVANAELAENLAFSLLSRTSLAGGIASKWLDAAEPLLRYCALLALSRLSDSGVIMPQGMDPAAIALRFTSDESPLVRGAAENLLIKYVPV